MATPHVIIDHSDDGGETFSHEMWYPLVGDSKDYMNRVVLYRQGSAYHRIYRLRFSENSSFTLISANAKLSIGI